MPRLGDPSPALRRSRGSRRVAVPRSGARMSEPAVSVVIPTRDRGRELLSCLRAIAAAEQPVGGTEVVVVNDGGAPLDAGVLAAAADGVMLVLLDQPGAGPAAARNRGATAAGGRVLAFTDDDCEPATGWLA